MSTNQDLKMRSSVQWMVRLAILIAITIGFQMFKLPQFITGPVVNLLLLIACMLLGMWGGVALGLITPLIAMVAGIMGRPEMVPVIMVANAILVIVFSLFRGKTVQLYKTLIGIIVGSILKYGVFVVSIAYIVSLPPAVAQMFGITQLFTALSGGVLAIIVEKALNKTNILQY